MKPKPKQIASIIITVLAAVVLLPTFGHRTLVKEKNNCTYTSEIKTVRGNSLAGLIEPGSEVRLLRGYYDCHEIRRGDIVAYDYAGNSNPIIKRVVGVPDDDWYLEFSGDGRKTLVINGVEQMTTLGDPYLFGTSGAKMLSLYPSPIPPGAYLILGNLPGGSTDSTQFGLVNKKDIIGKIIKVLERE